MFLNPSDLESIPEKRGERSQAYILVRSNFKICPPLYLTNTFGGLNGNRLVSVATKNSEYVQEIPQSQTADNPMAPQGRATQPSLDTRKTN